MNILVLHSQVPFSSGGAEILVGGLRQALIEAGHTCDIVALPYAWNPPERLLISALNWGLLNLDEVNGNTVDLVICTKFPTWAVRHPNKVAWVIHQHRQAYDLHGTALSEFTPEPASQEIRRRVMEIDSRGFEECKQLFAISENVAERLKRYSGFDAQTLYPPVPHHGLEPQSYEPFIFSASRLDNLKRIDALVTAWQQIDTKLTLIIAGEGPLLDRLRRQSTSNAQIEFVGHVSDATLVDYYNRCRAVYYAPRDEDYGYSAVEALTAGKAVLTAPDSGGVLEFVSDNVNGIVTTLDAENLGTAILRFEDEKFARQLGSQGPSRTQNLDWNTVVTALTSAGR